MIDRFINILESAGSNVAELKKLGITSKKSNFKLHLKSAFQTLPMEVPGQGFKSVFTMPKGSFEADFEEVSEDVVKMRIERESWKEVKTSDLLSHIDYSKYGVEAPGKKEITAEDALEKLRKMPKPTDGWRYADRMTQQDRDEQRSYEDWWALVRRFDLDKKFKSEVEKILGRKLQ